MGSTNLLCLVLSCVTYLALSGSEYDFVEALVLGATTDYAPYDLGNVTFNEMFQTPNKDAYVIKRECARCVPGWQLIYYKRYTNLTNVDTYFFMVHWMSDDSQGRNLGITNTLHQDFDLYSTFDDAINEVNKWQFCNYDDFPVGAFRDCGPIGYHPSDWTSRICCDNARFSIYVPQTTTTSTSTTTSIPTLAPLTVGTVSTKNPTTDVAHVLTSTQYVARAGTTDREAVTEARVTAKSIIQNSDSGSGIDSLVMILVVVISVLTTLLCVCGIAFCVYHKKVKNVYRKNMEFIADQDEDDLEQIEPAKEGGDRVDGAMTQPMVASTNYTR